MEWVETTGKTVDEAIELALDQLGVDEQDAEYEVVSEPKHGLFGRLRAEARVRARVRPATPRAKEDSSRQRKRRPQDRQRSNVKKAVAEQPSSLSTDKEPANASLARDSDGSDEAEKASRSSRSRRRKNPASTNEGASGMEEHVALAEQGEIAKEFVSGFFQQLSLSTDLSINVDEEEEIVTVAVEGENLGHFIGPRGMTLQSFQELTRTVVQRKTGARNGRIVVDISRYREKRRVALERFCRQIADDVRASGETKVLEPMHPADRKVVHDVINSIDGVESSSEGEEPRRRVVVKPAS